MAELSKGELIKAFEEMWDAATIGDTWKLNEHAVQVFNQIKEIIQNQPKAGKGWLPTSENINSLPDPIRKYIHDIETNCDPTGMVQENVILKDTCKALQMIKEPEVDRKFIETALERLNDCCQIGSCSGRDSEWGELNRKEAGKVLREIFKQAGIKIKED